MGPFLSKPGNILFSGLNAQILAAVTGHTFREQYQATSVDWKFLWAVSKCGDTLRHTQNSKLKVGQGRGS